MTKSQQNSLVKTLVGLYSSINIEKISRSTAFGIVINTINKDGESLQSKLGEKVAKRVTNRVLDELGYESQFVQTIADF